MESKEKIDEAIKKYEKALEDAAYAWGKIKDDESAAKALEAGCKMFLFEGLKLNIMNILGEVAGIKEE